MTMATMLGQASWWLCKILLAGMAVLRWRAAEPRCSRAGNSRRPANTRLALRAPQSIPPATLYVVNYRRTGNDRQG